MVIITHNEAKAAYNHVMDNVLGKDDSSGLKKALVGAGIENVFDLVNVDRLPLTTWSMTNRILKLMYTRSSWR